MKFYISKEVLEKFPDLVIYIPIIQGFDNTKRQKESVELMRECEKALRENFHSVEELIKDVRISSYFETFKKFGANPLKTMPTHFALAKRVLEGKQLPDINPIVNIYNALSIKYLTPFGGEDLETVYGDFYLTISKGTEHWKGINESEGKNPPKGSLIWTDSFDVSTVALNWRQCERTKLSETSCSGYFIMDGFKNLNEENISTATKEFVDIVTKIYGGGSQVLVLDRVNPLATIDFESKGIDGVEIPVVINKENKNKNGQYEKNIKTYEYTNGTVEKELQEILANLTQLPQDEILVSQTQNSKFGDYSSPIAMNMASKLKQNPFEIAKELSSKIVLPKSIEKVEAVMPGYINFFLSKKYIKESVLNIDDNYGVFDEGKGRQIMVEYGQPNTHKTITVGHVKSAITGLSVARLFETLGYDVIHTNYFGDIGPYVAKTIYSLIQTTNGKCEIEELNDEIISKAVEYLTEIDQKSGVYALQDEIGNLYVKGSKENESDENAKKTIRQINSLLFSKENEYINEIYEKTRALCIKSQDEFFSILGVKYDRQYTESEVHQLGSKIVKENIGNIFIEDQGAIIFPGEKYGLNRFVFMTSDGNPTYSGKDLGLVNLKFSEYPNVEQSIILTSVEQNEYFKVLIKAISLLYPDKAKRYSHIGFGWLLLNNKKTSSRGGSITLTEMLNMAIESAKGKIAGIKEYSDDEVLMISKSIALAGIKFNILSHEFYKDINYDPATFTSLTGYSAPYIMYSYTRANSVISKYEGDLNFQIEEVLESREEIELMRKLLEYPSKVISSAKNLSTHLLCEYLFELANAFNSFYTTQSILNANSVEEKKARVMLATKTALVIKKGLYILGIDVIEKM